MNRSTIWFAVLAAVSISTAGWSEPDRAASPLRLSLDLSDGSRVVGSPTFSSVPVQTSYAKVDIRIELIAEMRLADDHETVAVQLQNGDKLSGVANTGPIELDTAFGRVSIAPIHIRKISVMPRGFPGGLVLHYSFDNDENGTVTDVSGRKLQGAIAGNVPYEKGIKGMGIRTSSKDTYVICSSPELSLDGWRELTVTAWVRLSNYATYGCVVERGKEGAGGAFGWSVGGVYGGKPYDAGFSVGLGEGKSMTVTVKRFADLDQWYHVAAVYDGRTLKYYVNGKQAAAVDVPDPLKDKPIRESPGVDLIVGKSASLRSWMDTHINGMIDEVMLFNRALTETQIEQICNSQKP